MTVGEVVFSGNYPETVKAERSVASATNGIYSEHPDYSAYKDSLLLAKEAYFGDGGFLDGSRVVKYSLREKDCDYRERKEQSFYVNFVRPIINVFANAIFSTPPSRTEKFGYDLSRAMSSSFGDRDATMRAACVWSKLFSVNLFSVGRVRPGELVQSVADRETNGLRTSLIHPLNIIDWQLRGERFAWVKIEEIREDGRGDWRAPERTPLRRLRVWDDEGWYLFDEQKTPSGGTDWYEVDSGRNPLGRVPLFPMWPDSMREPGNLYGNSEAFQLAKINHRIFNVHSEITEQTRATAFNQLVFPTVGGFNPGETEAGAKQTVYVDGTLSAMPHFIAPDASPVTVCQDVVSRLIMFMFQIARLDSDGAKPNAVSSTQRIYINEESAKAIRHLAKQAQDAEKKLARLILELDGIDPSVLDNPAVYRVEYPTRYDHSVLADNFINRLTQMAAMRFPSQTMNRERTKFIISNMFSIEDQVKQKIFDEVESSDGLIEFKQSVTPAKIQTPATQHGGLDTESRQDEEDNPNE